MILLAAALVAGDAWTWEVALRYADAEGTLLDDRERWTLRVSKDRALTAERRFVGTVVGDGTLVPSSDVRPEVLKGKVATDGTLSVEGDWSDPAATKALRRLLKPLKDDERLADWPFVRRVTLRERDVRLPGGDLKATLRIDATLTEARLGGIEVKLPTAKG